MKKKTFKQRLNSYTTGFKSIKNNFINWLHFKKRLLQLWWADAPKNQINLEKGVYYLKKGTVLQVGQPVHYKDEKGITHKKYIKNLTYNFKQNKVQHFFSIYPIKGLSENFEERR